jgi:hypothetical protein
MQSPQAAGAITPGLPGISALKPDVMPAVRFLERLSPHAASKAAVLGDMQILQQPAGLRAAGVLSARRTSYARVQSAHFMIMARHAG